jgi:ABC-type nitrate/sulfonate/bicarbonate transport system substrate-binding protein
MRKLVMSVLIVFLLIPWGNVWAQVTRLNVGYVGINSDNVIAFIAKESGIFAKNGLDVQLIYFGGGTTATMALVAGETPITQTAGPGVVNAVLGGADAVMIAGGVTTLVTGYQPSSENRRAAQRRRGGDQPFRFGLRFHRALRATAHRPGAR